jgi:alpha,alpha-trehalase
MGHNHWGEPVEGDSPFPPIADYGFLSDCECNALVAPSGAVEWMCLPRPDSPSVFGAILDRSAGIFRVGPSDVQAPESRRYLPGTLVLETTWRTRTGWMTVRDGLLVGDWFHSVAPTTRRRAPTDSEAEHCLVRTVRCLSGTVELELFCAPVFDYGRAPGSWQYVEGDYGHARARAGQGDLELTLRTDMRLGFEAWGAIARQTLREGQTAFAALSWSPERAAPATIDEAVARLRKTAAFWRQWLGQGRFPDHRWSAYLQRSALTLKGLSYAPTGAMLAAATTSLPEAPGGARNWDYRYAWVRDATFMLWALHALGFEREANDFFAFLTDAWQGDDIQVMYGVGGERELEEIELPHLTGYADARPVRVGNAAYRQRQHDVWGAVLDSVDLHTRLRDRLPDQAWAAVAPQVEAALAHWREPDHGIWEVRGKPQHFTSSKVMCWVAADRGARLAALRADRERAGRWSAAAGEIHADVCKRGVDERGVFTQHFDSDALDASVLLLPLVGFLPPEDERIRCTVLTIADELTDGGLVLRYRAEETDDGMRGAEGAFTICTFWLISALVEIGEFQRARDLCEQTLSAASPLLLFAEEIEQGSRRHLGNFPQAFTHLALIHAVTGVIRAEPSRHAIGLRPAG